MRKKKQNNFNIKFSNEKKKKSWVKLILVIINEKKTI